MATETGPSGKRGCGLATPPPSDKMHPRRPGRPRPPGIPGPHRAAKALRADATRPSDVSRQGRKGRAVAKAPYGNGRREPRETESRKKVEGKTQGRNSERTQGCIQTPEASPPLFPGIPDGSGMSTNVGKHLSVREYPGRGSGDGHLADGRPRPERRWAPALYPSCVATCPGVPLGEPQGDGLLGLDGMKPRTFGCTLACPFRCALLPCPRSRFSPEPSRAHNAPKFKPPGSQGRNRCHGGHRVGRPCRT